MSDLKRILLVEDDPKDVELTLTGLAEYNLANEVIVARDGAEALDYLYHRGNHQTRTNGNPAVILLDFLAGGSRPRAKLQTGCERLRRQAG